MWARQRNGMNRVPIGGQLVLQPRKPVALGAGLISMNDVEVHAVDSKTERVASVESLPLYVVPRTGFEPVLPA